jgi:hypothetical protein
MCYLRYPGRVFGERENPYAPLLHLLTDQLGIPATAWDLYAARDATRRSHLLEVFARLGMSSSERRTTDPSRPGWNQQRGRQRAA